MIKMTNWHWTWILLGIIIALLLLLLISHKKDNVPIWVNPFTGVTEPNPYSDYTDEQRDKALKHIEKIQERKPRQTAADYRKMMGVKGK